MKLAIWLGKLKKLEQGLGEEREEGTNNRSNPTSSGRGIRIIQNAEGGVTLKRTIETLSKHGKS